MLCDTCQRQSHCLTHQFAAQDQKLGTLLERLQRCQQHQPIVQTHSFLSNYRQWIRHVVQKILQMRA